MSIQFLAVVFHTFKHTSSHPRSITLTYPLANSSQITLKPVKMSTEASHRFQTKNFSNFHIKCLWKSLKFCGKPSPSYFIARFSAQFADFVLVQSLSRESIAADFEHNERNWRTTMSTYARLEIYFAVWEVRDRSLSTVNRLRENYSSDLGWQSSFRIRKEKAKKMQIGNRSGKTNAPDWN